ncbi:hypothetical protein D050_4898B, partial [Vibrio parahaemolyticus VPCR-2009]
GGVTAIHIAYWRDRQGWCDRHRVAAVFCTRIPRKVLVVFHHQAYG